MILFQKVCLRGDREKVCRFIGFAKEKTFKVIPRGLTFGKIFYLRGEKERRNMATQTKQRYPLSSQPFPEIREGNYVYVDKTDMVYEMTHGDSNYIFLSRPRRFGKTLLVSTLKAYFEGRKDLFKGLAIEKLETEWTEYPVLLFSLSTATNLDKEDLVSEIGLKLSRYEDIYGRREDEIRLNQRLQGLVCRAYEQTGKKVVVLIDEYDAPLLDVVHEEENLPVLRKVMRNFYSPLKDLAPYLRFVFLTGITKFSQMSIFSELNNIENISMDDKYASVCGITEEEMLSQLRPGIERLAAKYQLTFEEMAERLKKTYDGYHFTCPSPDIYNPFSLLKSLSREKLDNYWFSTGTPTYLIEMLRKFGVVPEKIGMVYADVSSFDTPTETMTDAVPLLYQSGYLTIKAYDSLTDTYLLDIPNKEVRVGLMKCLVPEYVTPIKKRETLNISKQIYSAINEGRIDDALMELKKFLSTIPYTDNTDYEGHYQSLLYVIFSLIGQHNVDIEVRTATGRVDMALRTDDTVYLFELKLNGSAAEALAQIHLKNYPDRFALYGFPVVKVGISFDTTTHTLSDWEIER